MSVDHKRPLLAFAVVTVACIVILANAVRSEAFVAALRSEASHVVSGLGLAPADHRAGHRPERTPEAVPLVDAPRVAPVQRTQRPAPAALHGVPPRGHPEHAHLAGSDHAHAQHAGRHADLPRPHGLVGDQNGHRAHGAGQAHGHRGHGNHPGADHHAGRQGDRGPANAPGRGHPQPARQRR